MQSLQRCDLPPGAPRAIHSASKHAVKGPTKAGALEAAGNQVAARIGYLARRAAPVDGDGFQVLGSSRLPNQSALHAWCPTSNRSCGSFRVR
jgi:hypothetical protein